MAFAICYHRPDGGLSICRPAPWARRCSSIVVAGKTISFDDPVPFDGLVRAYKTTHLSPTWAESEEEFTARIRAKDVPSDADVLIIDDSRIPEDRTYRNAWKHDGNTVVHDMPKARELHRNMLRRARAPKLAELDIEYQRADERGDATAKQDVAARKQALRDCTKHPDIDAAATVDDLKKCWPL